MNILLAASRTHGCFLPHPWSGLPIFSGPTTLIAHKDHSRFFHLGFETDTPRYGDWKPELVNARPELLKSNWMIRSLRLSTLAAILVSTRPLCRRWLKTLVDHGLVSGSDASRSAAQALDGELDLASLRRHFARNGISKLELGWSRSDS